jgi:hypothetical protein
VGECLLGRRLRQRAHVLDLVAKVV